jgi:hypothetical protein
LGYWCSLSLGVMFLNPSTLSVIMVMLVLFIFQDFAFGLLLYVVHPCADGVLLLSSLWVSCQSTHLCCILLLVPFKIGIPVSLNSRVLYDYSRVRSHKVLGLSSLALGIYLYNLLPWYRTTVPHTWVHSCYKDMYPGVILYCPNVCLA